MAPVVTAYASFAEFAAQPEIQTDDPLDDVFINALLERASRAVDAFCGTWFYALEQTRYFDLPYSRRLDLDAPLLSVTTVTNGDGTVIAANQYFGWPYQGPHFINLELQPVSVIYWQFGLNGLTSRVVSVKGFWGYVDRAATDPESAVVIQNTTDAVLSIALSVYKKRYGQGVEGVAQVTAAGVVITPRGIPAEAKQLLMPYRRIT